MEVSRAEGERRAQHDMVLPVTSVRDGLEHLVAEEEMTSGNAGRYVAVCGRRVLAAVLAFPPGPQCSACVKVQGTQRGLALRTASRGTRRKHGRVSRPGRWAWVIDRLRRSQHTAAPASSPVVRP